MLKLKTEIAIVGSGAGGATLARELSRRGRKVLIIERGSFANRIGTQRAGLGFYDKCGLRTSREGTIIYRTLMVGGTTVVSCGNGLRVLDDELKRIGIDLSKEFEETEAELGIAPLGWRLIGQGSRLIMDAANRLGHEMKPMPKYIDPKKCTSCGKCVLGCPVGAKWSAVKFVRDAERHGAILLTNVNAKSVVIHDGRAIGIVAVGSKGKVRIYAEKVILAAGGIGTPVILKKSGIETAGNKLFADLFTVTYGILRDKEINLWKEPTMAVVSSKYMKSKGFIISPFVDVPLVLRWVMSKRKQAKGVRYKNLLGIMVKIQDERIGRVTITERFEKFPTINDYQKLNEGAEISEKILIEAGVKKEDIIFTKPRAAHPGGSAAIGEVVNKNLETDIKNLYVCDASVLPEAPGAPPIVTIVSLAKRLAKRLSDNAEKG